MCIIDYLHYNICPDKKQEQFPFAIPSRCSLLSQPLQPAFSLYTNGIMCYNK